MKNLEKPCIIVITGAESTGKTELTRQLGLYFASPWYPEYAREYLEKTGRPYTRQDVEAIAQKQLAQMQEAMSTDAAYVFFDTWLVVTKVWMEVAYGTAPAWIHEALARISVDMYLLCHNDIPWKPDPLRENGGEMREKLFEIYESNLIEYGFNYRHITGSGEERLNHALEVIRETEEQCGKPRGMQ